MIYDIVIVGCGASGMSAALYALRANKKVLILEKENVGGQVAISPRLENYPGFESISGLDFSNKLFEQITKLGCEFELEEVEKIEKDDLLFKVSTNYNTHYSKTVIIATGASHRQMGLPNENKLVGHGVSYCAVCDGAFYKGEEIYLIGDANTALQYANLLTETSPKVHIKALFDHFFGDQVLIDRIKSNPKIDYEFNVELKELIEENDELVGLKFYDKVSGETKTFKTNNCFICIGQIPHNEPFTGLVDMEKGYIVTNEMMETSYPGIFACGDTRKKPYRQLVLACNDGAIAALAAIRYIDSNNL